LGLLAERRTQVLARGEVRRDHQNGAGYQTMSDVTVIVDAIQKGDPKAAEELLPFVLRASKAGRFQIGPAASQLDPAAEAMHHLLVDRARRKAAARHGGGWRRLDLDKDENILLISEALEKLAAHDPASAELVKLRFFGGLKFPQAAEVMGISERTAQRGVVVPRNQELLIVESRRLPWAAFESSVGAVVPNHETNSSRPSKFVGGIYCPFPFV
jgi:hypothetical protein